MVQSNATYRPAATTERPLTRPNAGLPVQRGKESSTTSASSSSTSIQPITPAERHLLSLLSRLSAPVLADPNFSVTLQQVKQALYAKDYSRAFGSSEDYRLAYAARWVPSRALIYRRIFTEQTRALKKALSLGKAGPSTKRRAVMLGGGAGSEVLALGAWLGELLQAEAEEDQREEDQDQDQKASAQAEVEITAVDSSDWSTVLAGQEATLLQGYPALSTRSKFSVHFTQADILSPSASSPIDFSSAQLITLLFTISELFLQSRSSTLSLLSTLSSSCLPGTLLLIIESAALSLIPIGSAGNTYPLGMLLDQALAQDKGRERELRAKWEIVDQEEGKWYRMPSGAEQAYPLGLENSRVVLRLYRRV